MENNSYYIIFHKENESLGNFVCIVENEEIAKQFCRDFPDYYYLRRDYIAKNKEMEILNGL